MTRDECVRRLARACIPIIAGFDYDPGHSDLDDEQPITVSITLGHYRRIRRLAKAVSKRFPEWGQS